MKIPEMHAIGLVAWIISTGLAPADGFHVETVTGDVSYVAPHANTDVPLQPKTDLTAGDVVTDSVGEVYVSPAPGSEFRLAPGSKLHVISDDMAKESGGQQERVAALDLQQGKLTGSIIPGAMGTCCYDIALSGGRIVAGGGVFVVCIHGDGAHVYVADGSVTLFPKAGKYKDSGILLGAEASMGILGNEGEVSFQSMTRVAAGTSNCLLSGVSSEVVGRLEIASPIVYRFPRPISRIGPPVSPMQ